MPIFALTIFFHFYLLSTSTPTNIFTIIAIYSTARIFYFNKLILI